MIIDPSRIWATYYGGNGFEYGNSCAIDTFGNVYLAGNTSTSNNIASSGFQNTYGGARDLFLVKFNSSGVRQWATYYGDNGYEEGGSCTTDASGNVYLAGATKSASNIASGGFQNTYSAGVNSFADAFLVKFNSAGVRQWATYYGDTGPETGYACATDLNGNVYLAGTTTSTTNIAFGGFQNTTLGPGYDDIFLVKFNSAGVRQWATYYGGSENDQGPSCIVDANSNVYLSGTTNSQNNIASGGFQNTIGGPFTGDAFLVKFNSAGSRQWATYYGGSGFEYGNSCAIDAFGNVYLAGTTTSTTNITFGGFQNTFGGPVNTQDAFLVKFNSAGIRQWATYYGGTENDQGQSCVVDANSNVYLAGATQSTTNITFGGFQNTFGGGSSLGDAYLVKFNSAGVRQWGSYYGDNVTDDARACVIDGSGNVYLAGNTGSQSNIATGGYQNTYGGNFDAFLVKLDSCISPYVSLSTNNATCYNVNNGSATVNATGANLPFSYLWYTNPIQTTQTASNLMAGTYNVVVTNSVGCTSLSTIIITQPAAPNYSIAFSTIATTGNAPFFAGFSNSTPNMANYNFIWYWGDGTFTSSNNVNVTHTFANPGFYDVSLVATSIANGCSDTLSKIGYMFIGGTAGCSQNVTLSPNSTVNSCSGSNVLLTASTNAAAGFTYQWNINSVPISGATSNTYSATQSGYYSCTVIQAGCPVTSVPVNVVMNVSPPQPVISTSGNILPCAGGTTTLTASFLSGVTYSWSTGQTSQSIVVSTPGYYSVTSSYGSSSCSSNSAPFFVGTTLPSVPICMVSVDSLSTHNIVVWEKTGLPSSIDSFSVYRETMTNVFTKVGSLSSNALSVFHDYNANPGVTSYKYKIAAIDSCGSTSILSDYHETIHLQYFGLGNLQWTLYDIEAAVNPVNYYIIYRDNFGTGNFAAISSTIPGGNSTYTDINYASYPNASYKVETAWSISCNPTAKLSNSLNSTMVTRSNIIYLGSANVLENFALQNELLIYPNPASTEITISTPVKFTDVKLVNSIGQIVGQTKYSNTVSVVELSRGIYFMQLFNENGNLLKVAKFVKE